MILHYLMLFKIFMLLCTKIFLCSFISCFRNQELMHDDAMIV
uniref:Uncharacterized protein n=1 Tax=Arundo donax TaxID=35708 RepID=A0A0A9AG59_ARUDO